MASSNFTFVCAPPPSTKLLLPATTSSPLFTSFSISPTKPDAGRARNQARYREKHKEREQEKARLRMQCLRSGDKKAHDMIRAMSSEEVRASALFARYRIYLQRHALKVFCDTSDMQAWEASWDRFSSRDGPPFDRQDAAFLLRHSHPNFHAPAPTDAEIDVRLERLNTCDPIVEYTPEEEGEWRAILKRSPPGSNDDDLEWIFRHAVPAPRFEDMDACSCR
ncbi:hypothetical protein B0H11DRAFT_1944315 [Mycena galericulata]|nr:hypothetical protein B0H11DRAFT_1944315 [Mycena galericulata]